MYLLMLAAILLVLIVIAILVSNDHALQTQNNSLNIGTTINISNDELRKFIVEENSSSFHSDITVLNNQSSSEEHESCSHCGISGSIINDDLIVSETAIVPDTTHIILDENFVSRGIQTTDIARNNCISKDNKISSNNEKSLGLYNMSVRKLFDGYSGIIRASTWNGCCSHNEAPSFSYAYYLTLDESGGIKSLYPINVNYKLFYKCTKRVGGIYASGVEDPRIFLFNGEEWVMANCLGLAQQHHPCVNSMCIFKVSDPIRTFKMLTAPLEVKPHQRQKNWSPFEYNGELYCEYSIEPHVILKIDVDTGLAEEHWRSGANHNDIEEDASLRGGAPPILIQNPKREGGLQENFYLGIGHNRSAASGYLHFFYTFEATPPFKILQITPRFKLDGNERIQFAAGLSAYNDMIYISYGVDDCYNRISRFYLKDIISILKHPLKS